MGSRFGIVLALGLSAGAVHGGEVQEKVLTCLAGMGVSSDWPTCLGVMFAPCEAFTVGSDTHLACLEDQRADWRDAKRAAETAVSDVLTEAGAKELSGIMLAWPKFVTDKCSAVAESRAEISFEAADLGCQISEWVLMTNELRACAEGRSTEAYCQAVSE